MKGCKNCAIYKKRIQQLEEEVAYLKFELEQLRHLRYKKGRKRKSLKPEEARPKKKRGILGHLGFFRKKPKRVDKITEIRLTRCPECGSKDITKCRQVEEHIQEDIVLPEREVTLYRRYHYYCKRCKKVITARGKDELAKSYIGPKAKALAAFMKYGIKISDREIKKIFEKVFKLKISASSIVGFREQLKKKGYPTYQKLKQALRKTKFLHVDETGWKVEGKNRWVWKLSNKRVCITHIDESRGQKVIEEILGKAYQGILISDFLSAYNKIEAKGKQRCLVHMLRELDKVIDYWEDDEEVIRYCRKLKQIFEGAISLYKRYQAKNWDEAYYKRRQILVQRLEDFKFPNSNKRVLQRFVKRLNRHRDELFTFLYYKGIDYHNNHIEQQIRQDVIFRKITYGNRSGKGVENHNVLMSILQTAKLNKLEPLEVFEKILTLNGNFHLLPSTLPP